MNEPQASRPYVDPSYGVPTSEEGMLPWSHVVERMPTPKNYWLTSIKPDGRPHTRPVWGVWVENTLFFGGGNTRWAKNIALNPDVSVNLESGDDVVIIEGTIEKIDDPSHPLAPAIDAAYVVKYKMEHGLPVYRLRPRVVYAWTTYPTTVTSWRFGE